MRSLQPSSHGREMIRLARRSGDLRDSDIAPISGLRRIIYHLNISDLVVNRRLTESALSRRTSLSREQEDFTPDGPSGPELAKTTGNDKMGLAVTLQDLCDLDITRQKILCLH